MTKTKKNLEFIKFEHSIFALPFAYSGAVLAYNGIPGIITLIWITLAAVGARSAAMSLNRIIDAKIDALNPRTKDRHIPRGDIRVGSALIFTILSFILLFISAYQLNILCFMLSPILVAMFVIYPYLKRYTYLSHLFLGLCLGIAPVGGWLAITGTFEGFFPSMLVLASVVFWVAGFDIIYSIQDMGFDRKSGLHSIPQRFGLDNALKITLLFHVISVLFLIPLYFVSNLGFMFLMGIVTIILFLSYGQWIVRYDIKKIHIAFFDVNALVSVSFFVFLALDVVF
ncbi:MAG: hypothetical protein MSIBF_00025 [Candidatus Altiarchaeales archaeon IMC4]|nr:MAG: hypothetical protein MSIBF_00025 [Candidatus Altiarchaeales archaeon IMC4]